MSRMLFRVDANSVIGRGHLSRTLAVAEMFKAEYIVTFVVNAAFKSYCAPLLEQWDLICIDNDEELPRTLKTDDILWIDGYDFSTAWVSEMKEHVKLLVEINDLPQDVYGGDVIVNHCPGMSPSQYKDVEASNLLLGLNYAMLRPEFLEQARSVKDVPNPGEGVFVCFGGADPFKIGYRFVEFLLAGGFKDNIYFVTSDTNVGFNEQNVTVLNNLGPNEMMEYMTKSKVIVVPSSTLSFEAIALRKPIFTVYYVENQKNIYNGLVGADLVCGAGRIQAQSDVDNILSPFLNFYKDVDRQKSTVVKQINAVDGSSGLRLKEAIQKLA